MKYAPTKVISDDEVEAIHHASLRVLSEIGIDFLLPEALDLIAKSG
jgi:trimethylamine--corrinoid protein Co-methyltransferase